MRSEASNSMKRAIQAEKQIVDCGASQSVEWISRYKIACYIISSCKAKDGVLSSREKESG